MSSQPPNPPGVPDPRQWQAYREQQRARWRAQQQAWRSRYNAAYGPPHVPSVVGPLILVAIGVVGLLLYTGTVSASSFWTWYGHWWPMLLIAAGLALLGEWALDSRRTTPVRRGGGFVGPLILLALLGSSAAGWNHLRDRFANNWEDRGGDGFGFFDNFGLPEHNQDQERQSVRAPRNAAVEIENPRGDISITAGDGDQVEVAAHQVAFAGSDAEARRIFDAVKAGVTVSGSTVLIKSESNEKGRLNLDITVPRSASVTVNAGRGDITAAGLGSGATVTAGHGDVHLNTVKGPVAVHFSSGKGDFSAHQVEGDLTADGNCSDLTLSEVKGRVNLNGEIFGDVHIESLTGPLHLHTSMTDLQVAGLPSGDMTLNSDDLRVTGARGEVRVTTRARDVDLSEIYGNTYVNNTRGQISIAPAGSYAVEARNGKGDVELTLPPNASATVDAHTRNGDIVSDFPIPAPGDDESKTAKVVVGAGQARITVTTDVGDLHIKKGSGSASAPTPPSAPRDVPHLRAPSRTPPPAPVEQ